jgi:hypothetical protein
MHFLYPFNGLVFPCIEIFKIKQGLIEDKLLDFVFPDTQFLNIDTIVQNDRNIANLIFVEIQYFDG